MLLHQPEHPDALQRCQREVVQGRFRGQLPVQGTERHHFGEQVQRLRGQADRRGANVGTAQVPGAERLHSVDE